MIGVGIIYFFFSNSTSSYNKTGISGKVVSSGVYNEYENYSDVLKEFTLDYNQAKKDGKQAYLISGDGKTVTISHYEETLLGRINLFVGHEAANLNIKTETLTSSILKPENNKIVYFINNKYYEFELKPNEKFYFIVEE